MLLKKEFGFQYLDLCIWFQLMQWINQKKKKIRSKNPKDCVLGKYVDHRFEVWNFENQIIVWIFSTAPTNIQNSKFDTSKSISYRAQETHRVCIRNLKISNFCEILVTGTYNYVYITTYDGNIQLLLLFDIFSMTCSNLQVQKKRLNISQGTLICFLFMEFKSFTFSLKIQDSGIWTPKSGSLIQVLSKSFELNHDYQNFEPDLPKPNFGPSGHECPTKHIFNEKLKFLTHKNDSMFRWRHESLGFVGNCTLKVLIDFCLV